MLQMRYNKADLSTMCRKGIRCRYAVAAITRRLDMHKYSWERVRPYAYGMGVMPVKRKDTDNIDHEDPLGIGGGSSNHELWHEVPWC